MDIQDIGSYPRAALVVAHPGHELRVHGWLQQAQPSVSVLTDGSGHSGCSRLWATTRILHDTGAQQGKLYGCLTDARVYTALLERNFTFFVRTAEELAAMFIAEHIRCVVADAAEGYNPTHDVCRLLVDTAVHMAEKKWQQRIVSFDFTLVDRPEECPEALRAQALWFRLDERAFTKKRAAAQAYSPLAKEITPLLDRMGEAAFQVECLRPVQDFTQASARWKTSPPWYERYGETRVTAGYYQHVIRYHEHIKPLAEMLRRAAEAKP
ncbi:MAG: hypothetical protein AB7P69_05155 [Candidatus Binatia bacterium]